MSQSKTKLRKNAAKRSVNAKLVIKFCVENSINIQKITAFHFRLRRESFDILDVFPTSSKVHLLKEGQDYYRVDLIDYLTRFYS